MAYTAGTWTSPITISSTDKVIDTATNIQAIISDNSGSLSNFVNNEFANIESEISSNLTLITTVEANLPDINNVSENMGNIQDVLTHIDDINNYADTYYGTLDTAPTITTHPTLTQGDLYYDSALDELRVYDGSIWKSAGSTVNGVSKSEEFIAGTASNIYDGVSLTIFPLVNGYDAGYAVVYLNGKALADSDIDISNGVSVILNFAATVGDIIKVEAFGAFVLADHYTKSEVDANQALKQGDATQTFKVDDAINDDEALSKGQLLTEMKAVGGAGSGLDADTVDGVQGALLGIGGAGYAWIDETANRASGTTYTNTTGKPISVYYKGNTTNNTTGANHQVYVNGLQIAGSSSSYYNTAETSFIVPAGSTYSISETDGASVVYTWFELK